MVEGFCEETIAGNGFFKDFYNSTIVINYFVKFEPLVSMVFQWFFTILPSPLNQWFFSRPLGTMDFQWLMRKKTTMVFKNCNLRQNNVYQIAQIAQKVYFSGQPVGLWEILTTTKYYKIWTKITTTRKQHIVKCSHNAQYIYIECINFNFDLNACLKELGFGEESYLIYFINMTE